MTDFNEKLEIKCTYNTDNIGKFGLGDVNDRGQILLDYLQSENIY